MPAAECTGKPRSAAGFLAILRRILP